MARIGPAVVKLQHPQEFGWPVGISGVTRCINDHAVGRSSTDQCVSTELEMEQIGCWVTVSARIWVPEVQADCPLFISCCRLDCWSLVITLKRYIKDLLSKLSLGTDYASWCISALDRRVNHCSRRRVLWTGTLLQDSWVLMNSKYTLSCYRVILVVCFNAQWVRNGISRETIFLHTTVFHAWPQQSRNTVISLYTRHWGKYRFPGVQRLYHDQQCTTDWICSHQST